jgi:large subunit ribosomal protein L36e
VTSKFPLAISRISKSCDGPQSSQNRYLHLLPGMILCCGIDHLYQDIFQRDGGFDEKSLRCCPEKFSFCRNCGLTCLGIAVGMNKGHVVQRRELPPRPSRRKGYLSQKTKAVRSLIKEVVGYVSCLQRPCLSGRTAPYEKRIIELLRNNKDKRARKLAKKRVCLVVVNFFTNGVVGHPPPSKEKG